jgi:hypothetical protein
MGSGHGGSLGQVPPRTTQDSSSQVEGRSDRCSSTLILLPSDFDCDLASYETEMIQNRHPKRAIRGDLGAVDGRPDHCSNRGSFVWYSYRDFNRYLGHLPLVLLSDFFGEACR